MRLTIEGMHCQACVQRVRKALEKVDGATVTSVEVGSAEVNAPPDRAAAVLDAVKKAGYEARATG